MILLLIILPKIFLKVLLPIIFNISLSFQSIFVPFLDKRPRFYAVSLRLILLASFSKLSKSGFQCPLFANPALEVQYF